MNRHQGDDGRLIITFFARERPSNAGSVGTSRGQEDPKAQSMACGSGFAQLMEPQVFPASLTLEHHTRVGPGIFQSRYSVSLPFPNPKKLRHHASIAAFEALHAMEIVFDIVPHPPTNPLRPLKLAVFDMDSTLINEEVIDELARSINITSAVSAITARAMNGEIEFEQSLRERLALLIGVKADVWEELKKTVTIAAGAGELIEYLRARGVMTVVVSGGFAPMASWLKEQLGLDHAFANHVRRPISSSAVRRIDISLNQLAECPPNDAYPYTHLSGDLAPGYPIVTPEYKRHVLESLIQEHSIPVSETLVVGDGSNDLLMLGAAGLGIAWRAKERVQREAPQRLNGTTLSDLIYILGGGVEGGNN
ncbi:MAG: hypothetical protein Q9197_000373 [Variospora fuerteventurae]